MCVFLYSFGRAKVFGAHYLDLITDMIGELSPKHPTETEENLICLYWRRLMLHWELTAFFKHFLK